MIRRLSAVLAAAALSAAAGCGTPQAKVKQEVTVPLDVTKTRTVIAAHVGDLVKLELPPVELAGYGWQVFLLDSRYLKQRTEILPPAAPGGRATVSFLATQATPGKTTVRFLLVKLAAAREAQPVDGHDAVFTIEN